MLLITVCDTITWTRPADGQRTSTRSYLTDMSLFEFIASFNESIRLSCAKFERIGMGGFFHLINVTDVGEISPEQIGEMRYKHFSLTIWTKNGWNPYEPDIS